MNKQALYNQLTWKRFHILCQWTRDIHVLSRQMSHVNKAQAYTHWPTGCPNRARMKDPSLHVHGPSYKLRLGPVSMKDHRREQAYPSSKQAQMLEWPHCHFIPLLSVEYLETSRKLVSQPHILCFAALGSIWIGMIFSTGRKHHAWVGDGKDERSLFGQQNKRRSCPGRIEESASRSSCRCMDLCKGRKREQLLSQLVSNTP